MNPQDDLDVSLNGGTPQIIHFNRVFHYKPSILRYPYFWFNTHFNMDTWIVSPQKMMDGALEWMYASKNMAQFRKERMMCCGDLVNDVVFAGDLLRLSSS